MGHINDNLVNIRRIIEETCQKAGRNPDSVKLVAVSKTFPAEDIEIAYECGQREFGENRVQEIELKYPQLPEDISWHLIGTLQRNKVKYIVDKVSLIHSVDSISLAEEISKQAVKRNISANILLQINISGETSKHGFDSSDLIEKIKEIRKFPGIKIKGLMTIAPIAEDPEHVRPVFRRLKELAGYIAGQNMPGVEMNELSMGMSDDFRIAIEEGATIIRIGSGIFGQRNYMRRLDGE